MADITPDPTRPLLINVPATHFAELTGGDSPPSGTVLSRNPGAFEREKEGSGEGHMSSLSPPPKSRQAPTQRTQLQEDEKHFIV